MSTKNIGERVHFIEHQGVRMILLDFEGILDPNVGIQAAVVAKKFFAQLTPDNSGFSITDVRGTRYDRKIVEAFKDLTAHNRPYVRAAAVITNSALHKAAISMVALFSRRKLQVFETREEGLDYLLAEYKLFMAEKAGRAKV